MHCKTYSHFFSKKFQHIYVFCVSLNVNFNESLTNDVVSVEQLGPEFYVIVINMTLSEQTSTGKTTSFCKHVENDYSTLKHLIFFFHNVLFAIQYHYLKVTNYFRLNNVVSSAYKSRELMTSFMVSDKSFIKNKNRRGP